MLVSLSHRLVLLAMPKCASTAFEAALAPHMDVVITKTPAAKHTPYRKYERFLKRYFETFTDGPLEVVCLFREPLDWLGSWWRYRARAEIAGKANSTAGMSFEDFVTAYLDGPTGPAKVGSQAVFVSDKDGAIGVDRIYRYDRVADCAAYLAERLGRTIALETLNVSPAAPSDRALSPAAQARAERGLAREFEIYRDVAL